MQSSPSNCKQIAAQERAVGAQRSNPQEVSFVIFHKSFLSILGATPSISLAWEDADRPLAHEAGIYIPSDDCVFVTSNRFTAKGATEQNIVISKMVRESDGSWRREDVEADVPMANGGINYQGGCLFCSQGDLKGHRSALIRTSHSAPYEVTTLLDNFHGREFNSLNDVVVHSDGSIWFTDPIYGFEQGIRPKPQLPNQVYRFDPATGGVRAVADGFGRPNGICFSPDEETVYVTDTDWIHGDGTRVDTRVSSIYAFDVLHRQGSPFLANRRLFAFADSAIPDGIKCDVAGNVYSGCGDGIAVWNAGGTLLGKVLIPGGVANFCFGRKGEVFALNETRFWIVKLAAHVEGALLKGMGFEV